MKNTFIFVLLFSIHSLSAKPELSFPSFDKAGFYNVMASADTEKINHELKIVNAASIIEKEAYEGALLMRKAGLIKGADEKLKIFKSGRIKLEKSIQNDSINSEYRFLRITIQENAPRVLKYYKELEKDSDYIKRAFKSLSPFLQKAILDYAETSKVLRKEDL